RNLSRIGATEPCRDGISQASRDLSGTGCPRADDLYCEGTAHAAQDLSPEARAIRHAGRPRDPLDPQGLLLAIWHQYRNTATPQHQARPGQVDRRSQEPADIACNGQQDLATALWNRARQIERGLWQPGRMAFESGAARLSGLPVR